MNQPTKRHPIVAIRSRIAYENKWIRVREDETLRHGDERGIYGVVETKDSVIICAHNEKNDVYIVRTYSYPTDTWSWGLPGGGRENKPAEDAVRWELREEAGFESAHIKIVGDIIVSCGLLDEKMAIAVVRGLTFVGRSESDDDDSIGSGKFVSLDEARSMVRSGEICDAQTMAALYALENDIHNTGGAK